MKEASAEKGVSLYEAKIMIRDNTQQYRNPWINQKEWPKIRQGNEPTQPAWNVAGTNFTGMLQKGCGNVAGTLQERCRNVAGTLQERCRNVAGRFQECCSNIPQQCSISCEGILFIFPRNAKMSISILNWNMRGWRSKKSEMDKRIEEYEIFGMMETMAKNNHKIKFSGYNTYRMDRPDDQRGGGASELRARTWT
ncbi:hypothetical protein PV325_010323 [Microctonus aethiopoides]|nr:hypothetical protein PV325_010323 [Microctonus aethiopoides]